jgi:cytochrome c-type biogenesis protein CcmH/NrfG
MNQHSKGNPQRNSQPDNLDRILLGQDTLLPSSGFASSVMDAIQQQASAPAPIPFPWKWALPGIVALLAALMAALVFLGRYLLTTIQGMSQSSAAGSDLLAWFHSGSQTAIVLRTEAGPALLALLASLVCILLCRRLAVGGSAR